MNNEYSKTAVSSGNGRNRGYFVFLYFTTLFIESPFDL